mmetsp:Transcript_6097/g.13515  ORF Transcript_6097/g.13515 Transcript_6097/m.13515 type:complete len:693 (+) Transcript_6097:116-2194(+)
MRMQVCTRPLSRCGGVTLSSMRDFLVLLAMMMPPVRAAGLPSCSEDGLLARGLSRGQWPMENPSLIAPVTLLHHYEPYTSPLDAVLTEEGSYLIELPAAYLGGFTLNSTCRLNGTCASQQAVRGDGEAYSLRSIEIRRPGMHVSSSGQAASASHTMEVVLLHRSTEDPQRWATIIVPFTVALSASFERSLLSITEDTQLATEVGQHCAFNVEADQILNISSVFESAFLHEWTSLPTTCPGTHVNARTFYRRTPILARYGTLQRLLGALNRFHRGPAMHAAADAWFVNTWDATNSSPPAAQVNYQDQEPMLENALLMQSDAVAEVRERKDLSDEAFTNLLRKENGSYPIAESARNDLEQADRELSELKSLVERLTHQVSAAETLEWDEDAPKPSSSSASLSHSSSLGQLASEVGSSSTAQYALDCSALGQSPVAINTRASLDPDRFLPELKRSIHMFGSSPEEQAATSLHAETLADRIRVHSHKTAAERTADAATGLGSISAEGSHFNIDYVDVLSPAEHAVDGSRSAAEIQLIHSVPGVTPGVGRAGVVVSLRLHVAEENRENPWLAGLLSSPSNFSSSIAALLEAHPALRDGEVSDYFRYDGTMTSPPCSSAHWYLAAALGDISESQAEALRALIGSHAGVDQQRPIFKAGLVMRGAQTLLSKVTLASARTSRWRRSGTLRSGDGRRSLKV